MGSCLPFGRFAGEYDDGRPSYPAEAVDWLLEGRTGPVVDLGAGTGKLTEQLAERNLTVIAVEPDSAMLARLEQRLPLVQVEQGSAERIPMADHTVETVLVAQAWHWFDAPSALRELARVLTPSGRLGLLWNAPAPTTRWQSELLAAGPAVSPVHAGWWPAGLPRDGTEHRIVRWHQRMTADEICREHLTHLAFRKLPPRHRQGLLARMRRLTEAEARRLDVDRVLYERMTWCARRDASAMAP
jgi:SAM-dependent methyltransferase